jgi:hypothetical protein
MLAQQPSGEQVAFEDSENLGITVQLCSSAAVQQQQTRELSCAACATSLPAFRGAHNWMASALACMA